MSDVWKQRQLIDRIQLQKNKVSAKEIKVMKKKG